MMRIVKLPQGGFTERRDAYVVMEHITAITKNESGGTYIALTSGGGLLVPMTPQEVLLYLADPSNRSHLL